MLTYAIFLHKICWQVELCTFVGMYVGYFCICVSNKTNVMGRWQCLPLSPVQLRGKHCH